MPRYKVTGIVSVHVDTECEACNPLEAMSIVHSMYGKEKTEASLAANEIEEYLGHDFLKDMPKVGTTIVFPGWDEMISWKLMCKPFVGLKSSGTGKVWKVLICKNDSKTTIEAWVADFHRNMNSAVYVTPQENL